MQIIIKKISELKPYEKNHRTHPKKQIDLLAKNIERFGFTTPVLISKDNDIIAGHGRLLALKQLGKEDVSCVLMDNLSDEEVKALRLADNQIALMGDTDLGLAIEELKGLSDEMFSLTGFDADLLIEPDAKDDVIPENVEPIAKLGDIWQLGRHRVMCGDSTQPEAVLRLMEGKKADMVFTDPPYNIAYEGGSKKREVIKNDDVGDFYQFMVGAYTSMSEAIKSGASCYICHADTERVNFTKAFIDAGYKLSSVIIWVKNNSTFGRQDYFWKHEPILYGWKEGAAHC